MIKKIIRSFHHQTAKKQQQYQHHVEYVTSRWATELILFYPREPRLGADQPVLRSCLVLPQLPNSHCIASFPPCSWIRTLIGIAWGSVFGVYQIRQIQTHPLPCTHCIDKRAMSELFYPSGCQTERVREVLMASTIHSPSGTVEGHCNPRLLL